MNAIAQVSAAIILTKSRPHGLVRAAAIKEEVDLLWATRDRLYDAGDIDGAANVMDAIDQLNAHRWPRFDSHSL